MKLRRFLGIIFMLVALGGAVVMTIPSSVKAQDGVFTTATTDDLVFIHHSCGNNWLSNSLHAALLAKNYIDEMEITIIPEIIGNGIKLFDNNIESN